MSFLTPDQASLAEEIATLLTTRGEKVAVAESSAGGLISAALLQVPGASRYYAGGGVVYTLASRTQLAGSDPSLYENYRGTTPEMLASLAESMRTRLGADWCIAESGMAGPTGSTRSKAPIGRTAVAVVGPVAKTEIQETGLTDRAENMSEFTTIALRFLRDAIAEA
ncbi:MAG: CinA family protein [Chloroflexi bacterium]|nr:CinA family protein [Chloroflexota bacterium]MDA1148287.1 CinA family protein [Chloroflexota bacterium]